MQKPKLSPRQQQTLSLAALGHIDREIARQMRISDRTVRRYLSDCRERLGAVNTTNAVAIAMSRQIISLH